MIARLSPEPLPSPVPARATLIAPASADFAAGLDSYCVRQSPEAHWLFIRTPRCLGCPAPFASTSQPRATIHMPIWPWRPCSSTQQQPPLATACAVERPRIHGQHHLHAGASASRLAIAIHWARYVMELCNRPSTSAVVSFWSARLWTGGASSSLHATYRAVRPHSTRGIFWTWRSIDGSCTQTHHASHTGGACTCVR